MGSPVKGETLTLAGWREGGSEAKALGFCPRKAIGRIVGSWGCSIGLPAHIDTVLPPQGNEAHLGLMGMAVQWQVLPPQGNRAQAREAEEMAMDNSFVFGDAVL